MILEHLKTKARALHLVNDDPNNMFAIAFRTPVHDNTGVAHILEHSVLCGSRKFPAKDPFQELLKGSLQTFLNALTYPDKTVYPVSSQVEKDFYNLVDIYCDAVFHPLLSANTFLQEGWHFDVEKPADPIGIKGIVYNEMKGVFSDFDAHVGRRTISALFPDTTYFFESGGEPEHITDLTWEALRAFHARYYHPSNSFIYLYGNLPSEKTLAFLDQAYLREYDHLDVPSAIAPQPKWSAGRTVAFEAPAARQDDGTATVALSWLLGPATDPVRVLLGSILFRYLVGAESSPLRRALIDSGLGEDLDDITGFSPDFAQAVFAVGLRKTRPEHAQKVRDLIYQTLRHQAEGGVDSELLEGCIRQAEFRLREVGGGARFPYSLQLADRCFWSWLYDGDPLVHLKFDAPLSAIKASVANDPNYVARTIKELLVDNTHNLLSVVTASSSMAARIEKQTDQRVTELTHGFGDAEKRACHEQTTNLLDEQKRPSTPEALATIPKLRVADLPREGQRVPAERTEIAGVHAYLHPVFTSGIVYLDIAFDFGAIPDELRPWLPLYAEYLTRCGAAGMSYEEMSRRTTLSTGGIHASLSCHAMAHPDLSPVLKLFVQGKALPQRCREMTGIIADLLLKPDLANEKQLRDIVREMRNDMNASVIGSGNSYAMTHASSRLSRLARIDETLTGITQLRFLDDLSKLADYSKVVATICVVHRVLTSRTGCVVSVTADDPSAHTDAVAELLARLPEGVPSVSAAPPLTPDMRTHGIEIAASVNFVARVRKIAMADAATTGRLFLLARHLSTGYLWDKVRVEGGAYGASATFSSSDPIFACTSYRDPNVSRTLGEFDASLQRIASTLTPATLEQSIVGAIGKIDAPKTPHEKGLSETVALMTGRTCEYRQAIREAVLGATVDALNAQAAQVLAGKSSAATLLAGASALDEAEKQGVSMVRSTLLK